MMLLGLSAILKYYDLIWMWLMGALLTPFSLSGFYEDQKLAKIKSFQSTALLEMIGGIKSIR